MLPLKNTTPHYSGGYHPIFLATVHSMTVRSCNWPMPTQTLKEVLSRELRLRKQQNYMTKGLLLAFTNPLKRNPSVFAIFTFSLSDPRSNFWFSSRIKSLNTIHSCRLRIVRKRWVPAPTHDNMLFFLSHIRFADNVSHATKSIPRWCSLDLLCTLHGSNHEAKPQPSDALALQHKFGVHSEKDHLNTDNAS